MTEVITVRLEKPLNGINGDQAFASFGRNWDAIDEAARELEILSPFDFVSETSEEYAAMMRDVKEVEKELEGFDIEEVKNNPEFQNLLKEMGDDPNVKQLLSAMKNAQNTDELMSEAFPEESPGEEWYDAEEGLDFVTRLGGYIQDHPEKFETPDRLRQELQEMTTILEAAKQQEVGFYLALKS